MGKKKKSAPVRTVRGVGVSAVTATFDVGAGPDEAPRDIVAKKWTPLLLVVGYLLVVLAAVAAPVYLVAYEGRFDNDGVTLPFVDDWPTVTEVLLPPFGILLIASPFMFLGEMLRRGTLRTGDAAEGDGGVNVTQMRPLSFPAHALWVVALFVLWASIVPLPLHLSTKGIWPAPPRRLDGDLAFALGLYGGTVAAFFGTVLGSLLKKAWYVRTVANRGTLPVDEFSPVWRWVTYRWRLDVWLSAIGAVFLGLWPMALHFDDAMFSVVNPIVGAVLLVCGLVTSTFYWHANKPLGRAESIDQSRTPGEWAR